MITFGCHSTSKTRFRLALGLLLCLWSYVPGFFAQNPQESKKEYAIKASWLTKFIKYMEWPRGVSDQLMTIGILGDDPFDDLFEPIEGKVFLGKTVVIHRFGAYVPGMDFSTCDLLFISASAEEDAAEILKELGQSPILTVSEFPGFSELGGIINFLPPKKDRVRYEVNQVRAEQVGFRVTSPLLRYADRVISQDREGRIRY